MAILALVAAEFLIGPAIVDDITAFEASRHFPFLIFSVIHTTADNFAKLTPIY